MKERLNENTVKQMVYETVKRCIFENMDPAELIRQSQLNSQDVFEIVRIVFGDDAAQQAMSSRNSLGAMVDIYNAGTPEQQKEFMDRLQSGDAGIDFELGDDVDAMLRESVSRVVNEQFGAFLRRTLIPRTVNKRLWKSLAPLITIKSR